MATHESLVFVTRKKAGRSKHILTRKKQFMEEILFDSQAFVLLNEKIRKKMQVFFVCWISCSEVMEQSEYFGAAEKRIMDEFLSCVALWKQSCKDAMDEIQLVAFGLGSFYTSLFAQFQLAFLIALKSSVERKFGCKVSVATFDPMFCVFDNRLLEQLGITLLPNVNCLFKCSMPSIVYMPHCCNEMYHNLFVANWNHLQYFVLIGNSLANYESAIRIQLRTRACLLSEKDLVRRRFCFLSCLKNLKEIPLEWKMDRQLEEHAFNDTCVIRCEVDSSELQLELPPAFTDQDSELQVNI